MTFEEYDNSRQILTTPKGDFAYVDQGEGPPAVFVHGLFVSSYLWRHTFDELAGERRCIAFELPYHGGGYVDEGQPLSLAGLAECLEAFVDELGLDTFDLVANDTGAAIAQVFTVRNEHRVRTLTLTNGEARDVLPADHAEIPRLIKDLAEKNELAEMLALQLEDYEVARSDGGLGAGMQWPERLTDDDIRGYLDPHMRGENTRHLERIMQSLDREQLVAVQPQMEQLQVPTLLVWGTADPFFTIELAHWIRDNVPGVTELIEIDGAKLFWPGERPGELSPHLRKHWASVGGEAQTASAG